MRTGKKRLVLVEIKGKSYDEDIFRAHIKSHIEHIRCARVVEWIEQEKCQYSAVRKLYNETFEGHAVSQITKNGLKSGTSRGKSLKARWEDYDSIEWWKGYFEYCTESPFLMGKVGPRDGFRQFRLNVDYLINDTNLTNIMEGKYHE